MPRDVVPINATRRLHLKLKFSKYPGGACLKICSLNFARMHHLTSLFSKIFWESFPRDMVPKYYQKAPFEVTIFKNF